MPDEVNPYAVSESSLQLQPAAETFPMGLASRVRRLGAVAIDAAIIGLADYLVSLPAYLGVNPFSSEAQVLNFISGFGIFLLVNGYTLQTRGQTIGKLILGICIVDTKSGELAGLLAVDSFTIRPEDRLVEADRGRALLSLRIIYAARRTGGELRREVNGSTDDVAWVALGEVEGLSRVELVDVALRALRARDAGRE